MTQKNKSSLLLTLGGAILLIGGGVAAYYALMSRQAAQQVSAAASVIPQDAMIVVSLTTQSQQWQRLQQYGTPESKTALNQVLQQWRDRFFTEKGFDFQTDIQPWVGDEVMLAWLPDRVLTSGADLTPNSSLSSSTKPALVAVLPIANPQKAKEILAQPKSLTQGEVSERKYKGIDILETTGLPTENYSVAVLGQDFILVSNQPNATDRAIDTFKGGNSLAQTPGYASATQKIKTSRSFAQFYLNIPVATSVASFTSERPIPAETLERLQQNQGFASHMILESQGVSFKSISWLKPNSQITLNVNNNANDLIEQLPNSTILSTTGSSLQQVWQDYSQAANNNPLAPLNPQVLSKSLNQATGMDLEKDFLSWMDGEFSLSLIPAVPNKEQPQKFSAGFALMVETSDRATAEAALGKLDAVMKDNNFSVGEAQIQGQSVVKWTSPYGGFSVIRGWLNDNTAFATMGAPIADQFLPEPQLNLTANSLFKQTLPTEFTSSSGSFFVDLEQFFNPRSLSLPSLPPQQKIWVDAIRSIGITAEISNERSTRYDTIIRFKQIENIPVIEETEDNATESG
ncbi:MAG: DUF3352 domain-containing protein [Microcoleaceae cyanobacterium]